MSDAAIGIFFIRTPKRRNDASNFTHPNGNLVVRLSLDYHTQGLIFVQVNERLPAMVSTCRCQYS
jgi:hypothetical protein